LSALCKPTDPEDLVVDIFAGSNTTGQVAEAGDIGFVMTHEVVRVFR
jgi:DNA modification methylase